jgi:hypothetical protein
MMRPGDDLERRFDEMLGSYREAVPDPEASAAFMPKLWQKIDARQNYLLEWKRWTQGFLAGAVAASLLFVVLQVLPKGSADFYTATYLETLAEDQAPEQLVYRDVAGDENGARRGPVWLQDLRLR